MNLFKIDLYEHFKLAKPENGKGMLTCYVHDKNPEVNENRKKPAMLVLPGGGYAMCSLREAEALAMPFYAKGMDVFVLDYSVFPVLYPASLTEAVAAMAYIRENSERLSIDPHAVSAIGCSAGGHLCGMLGSFRNDPEVIAAFQPSVNVRPDAIVLCYPVVTSSAPTHGGSFDNLCGENEELKKKLDVLSLVNENSAPAFIWATDNDNAVPARNSYLLAAKYCEKGVPCSIHVWGKGWHGLSVADLSVYPSDCPVFGESSGTVGKWFELCIEWLKERNVFISDLAER